MKAILLGLSLFPLAVFAGEKIDKQIEVPKEGTVFIENQRGDVSIAGWDKSCLLYTSPSPRDRG